MLQVCDEARLAQKPGDACCQFVMKHCTRTINVSELALGLISTFGCFSGAQEHVRRTEHGSNGDDLVGTTAGSTQGPIRCP